jgi:hypothetical protein
MKMGSKTKMLSSCLQKSGEGVSANKIRAYGTCWTIGLGDFVVFLKQTQQTSCSLNTTGVVDSNLVSITVLQNSCVPSKYLWLNQKALQWMSLPKEKGWGCYFSNTTSIISLFCSRIYGRFALPIQSQTP